MGDGINLEFLHVFNRTQRISDQQDHGTQLISLTYSLWHNYINKENFCYSDKMLVSLWFTIHIKKEIRSISRKGSTWTGEIMQQRDWRTNVFRLSDYWWQPSEKWVKGDLLDVFHRNWDEKFIEWALKSPQEKEGVRMVTAEFRRRLK